MSLPSACQTPGNSDLYGLGVRVGLYAQWMATLLTTLFIPRDEGTYRLANLIIQTSIFLGLCIESDPGSGVVGAIITQYLLMGSLSSLTGDGVSDLGHVTGIFRVLFYLAFSSYGVWFWHRGIHTMALSGCPDTAEYVFFGKVTIHGWFRILGLSLSIFGVVFCTALLGVSYFQVKKRIEEIRKRDGKKDKKGRPEVDIALLALSVGLIGCSIYLIEHLIIVNNITQVGVKQIGTVGQLIPLLVGGFACVLTIWRVLVHRLFLRKRCWYFFGFHL